MAILLKMLGEGAGTPKGHGGINFGAWIKMPRRSDFSMRCANSLTDQKLFIFDIDISLGVRQSKYTFWTIVSTLITFN